MYVRLVLNLSILDAGILILDIIDNALYGHCGLVPLGLGLDNTEVKCTYVYQGCFLADKDNQLTRNSRRRFLSFSKHASEISRIFEYEERSTLIKCQQRKVFIWYLMFLLKSFPQILFVQFVGRVYVCWKICLDNNFKWNFWYFYTWPNKPAKVLSNTWYGYFSGALLWLWWYLLLLVPEWELLDKFLSRNDCLSVPAEMWNTL